MNDIIVWQDAEDYATLKLAEGTCATVAKVRDFWQIDVVYRGALFLLGDTWTLDEAKDSAISWLRRKTERDYAAVDEIMEALQRM